MRLRHLRYRFCFHLYTTLSLSGWTVPHIFSLLPVTADCTGWYNFLPTVLQNGSHALTETYVIFITENDVLKSGLPIYHIDRIVQETGEPFGDEAHIIYVNSQIKDETELGKLMHDFSCTDPKDMYYKILADRVRYFKEDEEGVLTMCREMENMRKESSHEKAVEIAKRMLASGKLTYEDIAVFTDLTLEEIKALAVQKTA